MPKVYNIKHGDLPKLIKYIGRGSIAGNPFKIGKDGNRDEVCNKFEAYIEKDPRLKHKLIKYCKGWDLACYCKPLRCHGDYLLKISN